MSHKCPKGIHWIQWIHDRFKVGKLDTSVSYSHLENVIIRGGSRILRRGIANPLRGRVHQYTISRKKYSEKQIKFSTTTLWKCIVNEYSGYEFQYHLNRIRSATGNMRPWSLWCSGTRRTSNEISDPKYIYLCCESNFFGTWTRSPWVLLPDNICLSSLNLFVRFLVR